MSTENNYGGKRKISGRPKVCRVKTCVSLLAESLAYIDSIKSQRASRRSRGEVLDDIIATVKNSKAPAWMFKTVKLPTSL